VFTSFVAAVLAVNVVLFAYDARDVDAWRAAPWLLLVVAGIAAWASAAWRTRRRRRARQAALGSGAPWERHGYWSRGGEARYQKLDPPGHGRTLRTWLLGSTLAGVFASAVLAWRAPSVVGWTLASAAVSGVVCLGLSWRGFVDARVTYHGFPYRVGGPIRLDFSFARHANLAFDHLAFTLQCVVETPRLGGLVRPDIRRVFAQTIQRGDDLPAGSFDIDLVFDVPADAPGADPLATPAVYWELAVLGEGPGFRYEDVFLVPIYARPADGAAERPAARIDLGR
jgi:hypothetical protein